MSERPYILTIEISEHGATTAKMDDGKLSGGRQDVTYEIDRNITRQLIRKQFAAIHKNNIEEARAAGGDLMQHLLPKEIRARFPQDGEALLLSTNRQGIPWELLWDGDFLGVRFAMGRQLITRDKIRQPGVRLSMIRQLVTVDEVGKPESEGKTRQKNCLFLTNPTDDLPESRKEARQLMEYFRNHGIACTLIAGEQITAAEIYSYLRSKFDIVHYSGHIDMDEDKGAYLRLAKKDRFYLSTALTLDDFGRPFVFLNGCGGGPAWGGGAKIVRPLIAAGCGPILCATMQITDKGSRLFSEQLIANVLLGMSYGKATMEARKKYYLDPSGGTDWMRFVYYGNPLECMEMDLSESMPVSDPDREEPQPGPKITTDLAASVDAEVIGGIEKELEQLKHEDVKVGREKPLFTRKNLFFLVIAMFAVSAALFFFFAPSAREDGVPAEIIMTEPISTPLSALHEPQTPSTTVVTGQQIFENAFDKQKTADPPRPPVPSVAQKTGAASAQSKPVAVHPEDFYGIWKNDTDIVTEISRNELTRSLDGVTFRMNIGGVEPVSNSNAATRSDYPSGVRFSGTVAEKGWWIDSPEIGATHSYTFFLHPDGKSFSQNGSSDSGNMYKR